MQADPTFDARRADARIDPRPPDRRRCAELDAHDPLRDLRDAFDLPAGLVYLDGNSLGARPRAAVAHAETVLREQWGERLIRSWNEAGWFELPRRLGDRIAPLIGAGPDEVMVADTTSINLFKVLAAALGVQERRDARRRTIVSERDNFPTDLYIAQGLAALLARGHALRLVDHADALADAVDDDTAVLLLTHVNYRTGAMHDMAALTGMAHARGALAVWDLAHSAGAVPVDLRGAGADYAVGCTYKYLNGGPGAPAFVWAAPAIGAQSVQPLSGWWGHAEPFRMEPAFRPAAGAARWQCGTQPVLALAMIDCALDVFERTGIAAVRDKSVALTGLFIELVEARCAAHPLRLVTPREPAARGSQVSFEHPHGQAVMQALIRRGVIGDYREPGILRFGFAPLYNRFVDAWDAADALGEVLDSGAWQAIESDPRQVVT